jgi:hypothetical protein
LTTRQLVTACGRLRLRAAWDAETTATAASLRALARRIQLLDAEIAEHTRAITTPWSGLATSTCSPMRGGPSWPPSCVRPVPSRPLSGDAAFAMLGGAAPIPPPAARPSASG